MTAARPRSTGHPGYDVTRPREPRTAGEARRLVHVVLSTWCVDDAEETAVLVMSELVTNAVRHARGRSIRIIVDRPADDRVYLAVVDRAPGRLPTPRTPTAGDDSGRGLPLIDDLADRWGYDLLGPGTAPWGKRVWALLEAK
ncbi:ATP-binding protein [Streptomyces sp. NPDC055210]